MHVALFDLLLDTYLKSQLVGYAHCFLFRSGLADNVAVWPTLD